MRQLDQGQGQKISSSCCSWKEILKDYGISKAHVDHTIHVDILYPDIMDKNDVNISLKYIQQHILPQITLIGNC